MEQGVREETRYSSSWHSVNMVQREGWNQAAREKDSLFVQLAEKSYYENQCVSGLLSFSMTTGRASDLVCYCDVSRLGQPDKGRLSQMALNSLPP
jgi:hypothetical protein